MREINFWRQKWQLFFDSERRFDRCFWLDIKFYINFHLKFPRIQKAFNWQFHLDPWLNSTVFSLNRAVLTEFLCKHKTEVQTSKNIIYYLTIAQIIRFYCFVFSVEMRKTLNLCFIFHSFFKHTQKNAKLNLEPTTKHVCQNKMAAYILSQKQLRVCTSILISTKCISSGI
jgi:hypothetical protein